MAPVAVDLDKWVNNLRLKRSQVPADTWENFTTFANENSLPEAQIPEVLLTLYSNDQDAVRGAMNDTAALLEMMLQAIDAVPGKDLFPDDESWHGYVALLDADGNPYCYAESPGLTSTWYPVEVPGNSQYSDQNHQLPDAFFDALCQSLMKEVEKMPEVMATIPVEVIKSSIMGHIR
ncbi:hypothetical protein [Streptomyces sp. NPDC126514]|uniref:hypothetical protein n=1 Tax=Streptomyces sp. NPDC126514 TaxID=3155210 RepID=UPI003331A04D